MGVREMKGRREKEALLDAGAHFAGRSEHLGQPASNQLSLPIAAE